MWLYYIICFYKFVYFLGVKRNLPQQLISGEMTQLTGQTSIFMNVLKCKTVLSLRMLFFCCQKNEKARKYI